MGLWALGLWALSFWGGEPPVTLAHTQSKGREYETFQPTREKRRSASCRLRVVGRGQATPMIVIFIYAYVAFRMDENPVSYETVKMGWASIWSWAGFLWWWNMIKWLKSDEFLIFPKEWSIQCLMEMKRATKNLMESPLKSWAKRHFRMLKH